eukprot:5404268-Pleurochrysis_carterae.AAC.1
MEVELAAAAQSVRDKDALAERTSALLAAAEEAARQAEAAAAMFKGSCVKLQARLKASGDEITRGNAIIQKLQADIRALKGKLKLKAAVLVQQQEQAAQKQQAIDAADRSVADLRAQLTESAAEKTRAEEGAAELKRQLSEAQELLRSNQQVITWLNKELNETQAPRGLGGAAFRPSLPRATGEAARAPHSFKADHAKIDCAPRPSADCAPSALAAATSPPASKASFAAPSSSS